MSADISDSRAPASQAPVAESEYELQLFIAGPSLRAEAALRNLEAICARYLVGRHSLTVVDLLEHPERAQQDGILGVPCLVKLRPGLIRRLVGDLSQTDRVLKVLGLA
ncbi:circadian clock KaiB family protein [Hymenobacter sp. DH14]|uniref:Circadian clock KaiB family protein n=1 Tax=Hymenobacter cyanobacteriorum TaxID=2926463 RepID=A0A9X1VJI6_9BACT|nr:circadian clock KaiB family protein [Hymenobacter cyanobacteriorum]